MVSGVDPLEKPLDDANSYVRQINKTLDDIKYMDNLGLKCYDQTTDAVDSVQSMFLEIISIVEYARCEHLNRVWSEVVEDGFCEEVFSGFYVLWVSQLAAAACLFVLMVLTSMVYPSYKGRFYEHCAGVSTVKKSVT